MTQPDLFAVDWGKPNGDRTVMAHCRHTTDGSLEVVSVTHPDTQRDLILAYLLTGHTITPLEALDRFGCFRLGARVWELKQAGYRIATQMIAVGDKRVAQYRLSA